MTFEEILLALSEPVAAYEELEKEAAVRFYDIHLGRVPQDKENTRYISERLALANELRPVAMAAKALRERLWNRP